MPLLINSSAICLTKGVFPVPPIVRLPTTIIGISESKDSYSLFKNFFLLLLVIKENIKEWIGKYNHKLFLYQLSTTKLVEVSFRTQA